tara:strand:- start:3688 stop:4137 length:450 start_codon:yes stop_codon:yes gene_type:complete
MRENQSNTFQETNWLDIPSKVKERFTNSGLALRWIRILIKGADDYQNIGKRQADGWEFVSPEDVPEMLGSSSVREDGRYAGAICRGDLALAKMPLERAKSRQEFYETRSQDMVRAVNAQLMGGNNSRMPISNSSQTKVSRGKVPKFQED